MTTTKKTPATWLFFGSLAISFLVVWQLLVPLSVGAVLAYVSERPIDAMARRFHREGRTNFRWLFAVLFVFAAFLVFMVPLAAALYVAIRDLARLLATSNAEQWGKKLHDAAVALTAWGKTHGVELDAAEITAKGRTLLGEAATKGGLMLGAVLSATPDALFNVSVIVLTWLFLAVEGPAARERILPRLIPWEREREILREIAAEVIQSVLVANVLVSMVQAVIASITLLALGVPRAFVWGVITFFLSFVPVVGTTPVTIGATIWLFLHGRPTAAIVMGIIAIAVTVVDNIMRPLFMRSSVELNFLWILVALIGGVGMFGLPGVILGPMAFSLFVASLHALEAIEAEEAAIARGEEPPRRSRLSVPPGARTTTPPIGSPRTGTPSIGSPRAMTPPIGSRLPTPPPMSSPRSSTPEPRLPTPPPPSRPKE